jgi:hypothetical protein
LVAQPVAVGSMRPFQRDEVVQQTLRFAGVMPVALQLSNDFALPLYMNPRFGDMLFGLGKVIRDHLSVHGAQGYHSS